MEINLTIRDADSDNVEFDWHELEDLIRGVDDVDMDTKITGALIICLTIQRMMQVGLVQPMAMLACQDLLQKMRQQQQLRAESGAVEKVEVDVPATDE